MAIWEHFGPQLIRLPESETEVKNKVKSSLIKSSKKFPQCFGAVDEIHRYYTAQS